MRRILTRCNLLFINHGTTGPEREATLAIMTNPMGNFKAMKENRMMVRVERNVETDVPEWCAHTNTWAAAKADHELMELVCDDVDDNETEEEISVAETVSPRARKARKPLTSEQAGEDVGLNA